MALDVKLSLQQMMVLRVQQMGAYFSSRLVFCTCYLIACKILSKHIIIFDDCPQSFWQLFKVTDGVLRM